MAFDIRIKCRDVTPMVVDAWIAEVQARGEYWMRAAELLVAYAIGKPKEHVEVTGPEGGPLAVALAGLTIEQVLALVSDEKTVDALPATPAALPTGEGKG
jgi:hypothetical protein